MRSALCLLALVLPAFVAADTFHTRISQPIQGRLSGVYGDLVLIAGKNGSILTLVEQLDDDSLLKVADFLETRPPPPRWTDTTSRLGKGLVKKLKVLRDGKLVAFDAGDRPEPEFYLIYFGAYWCGPCRRFSPSLVATYHKLKQVDPDRFEVIFVSDDEDASGQLAYAREVKMPFPILRFGQSVAEFDRWRGRGIPCLVVLNRQGDLLFHSYQGEEYLGADDPLEKFSIVHAALAQGETRNPTRHRLAVAQHIRRSGGGNRPPQAYLLDIDLRRNRTLPEGEIDAVVEIDATGHVRGTEFKPQLEVAVEQQLRQETDKWLFLPAVKEGKPAACKVELALERGD